MTGGVNVCASCGGTWTAPPERSCPYCGARDDDELEDDERPEGDDLLYTAWTIIANAHGGRWSDASPEWRDAARRWRDRFHARLADG